MLPANADVKASMHQDKHFLVLQVDCARVSVFLATESYEDIVWTKSFFCNTNNDIITNRSAFVSFLKHKICCEFKMGCSSSTQHHASTPATRLIQYQKGNSKSFGLRIWRKIHEW